MIKRFINWVKSFFRQPEKYKAEEFGIEASEDDGKTWTLIGYAKSGEEADATCQRYSFQRIMQTDQPGIFQFRRIS